MNKKISGLGQLSQLSGLSSQSSSSQSSKPKKTKKSTSEKLTSINIKIHKEQKDWLTKTASQVRENNSEPVAPSERVYPQHLIRIAVDLLQSSEVDWSQVRNIDDLQEQLNL